MSNIDLFVITPRGGHKLIGVITYVNNNVQSVTMTRLDGLKELDEPNVPNIGEKRKKIV